MARAHAIDTRLEKLIPSLEEFHLMGVLTKDECHGIIKDRTFHEYRLVAKPLLFIDVQNAITCELGIEAKIVEFCKIHDGQRKKGDKDGKPTERVKLRHRWDVQERIEKIFIIGMKHLKNRAEREELRQQFVKQMIAFRRTAALSKQYAMWLTLSPNRGDLWAEAALFEASGKHQHGTRVKKTEANGATTEVIEMPSRGTIAGRIEEARSIIQHAISNVPHSEAVWLAALTIEMNFAQTLLHTTAVEAVDSADSDPVTSITGPNAPEQERAMGTIMLDLGLARAVVEWAATTTVGGIVRDDDDDLEDEDESKTAVGTKRQRGSNTETSVVQSLERPALSPSLAIAMFDLLLQYQFAAELAPFILHKALEAYVGFLSKHTSSKAALTSRHVLENDIQRLFKCILSSEERTTRRNCTDARSYLTEQVTKELELLQDSAKEGAAKASLLHKGYFRKRHNLTITERRNIALKNVVVTATLLMRHFVQDNEQQLTVYDIVHKACRDALIETLNTVAVIEKQSRGSIVIQEFSSDDVTSLRGIKTESLMPLFTAKQRSIMIGLLAGSGMPKILIDQGVAHVLLEGSGPLDAIMRGSSGKGKGSVSQAALTAYLRKILAAAVLANDGKPGDAAQIESCLEAGIAYAAAASATLDGTLDQLVEVQKNSKVYTSAPASGASHGKASFSTMGIFVEDSEVEINALAGAVNSDEQNLWSSDLLSSLMLPEDYRAMVGTAPTATTAASTESPQERLVKALVNVDCAEDYTTKLQVLTKYLTEVRSEIQNSSALPPVEAWKALAALYVICSSQFRAQANCWTHSQNDNDSDSSDDEDNNKSQKKAACGRATLLAVIDRIVASTKKFAAGNSIQCETLFSLFSDLLNLHNDLRSHINTSTLNAGKIAESNDFHYHKGFYVMTTLYVRDVLQLPSNELTSCNTATFIKDHVLPVTALLKSITTSPSSIRGLVSQVDACKGGNGSLKFPFTALVKSTRALVPFTSIQVRINDVLPSVVHRSVLRDILVPCAMVRQAISGPSNNALRREFNALFDRLAIHLYSIPADASKSSASPSRHLKQVRHALFEDITVHSSDLQTSITEPVLHTMQVEDNILWIDAELYICKSPATSKQLSSTALKNAMSPKLLLGALQARQNQ